MTNIFTAPVYKLENLNNIFIELTAKNCNQRCKNCYINLPLSTKIIKDFIPIDKIKEALEDTKHEILHCIYLTGAEPMLHPDFNHILRLCLKYNSVVIHTNALNINDKKARFLRKVEDENNLGHEIIFMISIDNHIEKENDELKSQLVLRKPVLSAPSAVIWKRKWTGTARFCPSPAIPANAARPICAMS